MLHVHPEKKNPGTTHNRMHIEGYLNDDVEAGRFGIEGTV
jgi:hypothetical protein